MTYAGDMWERDLKAGWNKDIIGMYFYLIFNNITQKPAVFW